MATDPLDRDRIRSAPESGQKPRPDSASDSVLSGSVGDFHTALAKGVNRHSRKRFEVTDNGPLVIVTLTDKRIYRDEDVNDLARQLFALIPDHGSKNMIIDFGQVEYICPGAVGHLITMHNKVVEQKGILALSNIAPLIREAYYITKLDKFFNIFVDGREAQLKLGQV